MRTVVLIHSFMTLIMTKSSHYMRNMLNFPLKGSIFKSRHCHFFLGINQREMSFFMFVYYIFVVR